MNQRTLAGVMREFLNLQIEQNEVALEVVNKQQLVHNWNNGIERSRHNCGEHGHYWDSVYSLECQNRCKDEEHKAHKKFEANQQHLKKLKDEVVALMTVPR